MRKLSKNEMKAVSGGYVECPVGMYFSTTTYNCVFYPVPPAPRSCPTTVWVYDNYGQGYWKTVPCN